MPAAAADIAARITMGINHSCPGQSDVSALTNVVVRNMKPKLMLTTDGIGDLVLFVLFSFFQGRQSRFWHSILPPI